MKIVDTFLIVFHCFMSVCLGLLCIMYNVETVYVKEKKKTEGFLNQINLPCLYSFQSVNPLPYIVSLGFLLKFGKNRSQLSLWCSPNLIQ